MKAASVKPETDFPGQEASCLLSSAGSQLLIPVLLACNSLDQPKAFVVQCIAHLFQKPSHAETVFVSRRRFAHDDR